MQTIPSSFDICCFVFAKMNKRILLINKIPQSIIDSFSTCSGERMAENPRINKMLNRLEPIAFPSARPLSPFLVATMEVTSSGREVPIATMVSPIMIDGTCILFATLELPSTKKSAPLISSTKPITRNTSTKANGALLMNFSIFSSFSFSTTALSAEISAITIITSSQKRIL